MNNYEVTFIVDPVLSREEIDATAQTYVDLLQKEGCKIVHVDKMGLRQLAYTINKRTSGEFFTIEFQTTEGSSLDETELALRRDERIMRFLTVRLDKFGVKYNDDKRNGRIASSKKRKEVKQEDSRDRDRDRGRGGDRDRDRGPRKPPPAAPRPSAPPVVEDAED